MGFVLAFVIGVSILVLTSAQDPFKGAGHGKPCVDFSPYEPMRVCDTTRGFDCVGVGENDDRVCACYGTFVYDKTTKECRRKVGDTCQPHRKGEEAKRAWSEKCQGDAECSDGICVCKEGLAKSLYTHSCVLPDYLRGGDPKYAKKFNAKKYGR